MSTVYNVITRYRVDGLAQARTEASAMKGAFSDIGKTLKDSLFSVRNVMAGGLVTAGLAQAATGLVGLNSTLEQSSLSIATLFNVNNVYKFSDALVAAKGTFTDLRADAAAGLGELQDYLGVYQQILSPSLQTGASLDGIRQLNKLLVAGGFALRGKEGPQLAGFDVQQALTTGVGQRTTPIVNQALQAIGVTTEAFNALAAPERFQMLLKAFQAFEPAIAAQSKSWEGVSSTFRDTVKEVAASATQPLFVRWTQDLIRVNEWLGHNGAELERIEAKVGGALVAVWERSIELVRNWRTELQAAIPLLSTLAVIQMAGNANLLNVNKSLFDGLGRVGQRGLDVGGVALGTAGAGLSAVNRTSDRVVADVFNGLTGFFLPALPAVGPAKAVRSGMGIADDFGDVFAGGIKGGVFSGAGGLGMEAIAGLRGLASALNPLANIVGKVMLPIALISAAFSAFTANTFGAASFLKDQALSLVEELKVTLGAVVAIFDNGIIRTLGAGLITVVGGLFGTVKWLLKGLNAVLVPIATGFQAIGIVMERGVMFIQEVIKTRSFSKAANNFWAGMATDIAGLEAKHAKRFKVGKEPDLAMTEPATPKAHPVPKSVVNIGKVEVHQKVEQNADPDRVSWAWNEMLSKLTKHPRQSRVSPTPMGV